MHVFKYFFPLVAHISKCFKTFLVTFNLSFPTALLLLFLLHKYTRIAMLRLRVHFSHQMLLLTDNSSLLNWSAGLPKMSHVVINLLSSYTSPSRPTSLKTSLLYHAKRVQNIVTSEVLQKRTHQIRAKLQTQKISPEIKYDFTFDRQTRRSTKLLASQNKKIMGESHRTEGWIRPQDYSFEISIRLQQWPWRGPLKLQPMELW